MADKTENTKAAPVREDEQPVTKLARVNDPAKLTKGKIDEIAGEHSDETDPEQAANVDVAETLEKNRADAKSKKFGDPDIQLSRNGGAQSEPG
jgi:hypothetical protein